MAQKAADYYVSSDFQDVNAPESDFQDPLDTTTPFKTYDINDAETISPDYPSYDNPLDQLVAPGLRLWMLLGMILSVLLLMVIIVCCFMRVRIPRTKREIEMMTARRRMRKKRRAAAAAIAAAAAMADDEDSGGPGVVSRCLSVCCCCCFGRRRRRMNKARRTAAAEEMPGGGSNAVIVMSSLTPRTDVAAAPTDTENTEAEEDDDEDTTEYNTDSNISFSLPQSQHKMATEENTETPCDDSPRSQLLMTKRKAIATHKNTAV